MLALVEGKAAPKPTADSLWVALNQRASVDPDRLALLSPRQPADLLSELVQLWPRGTKPDGQSNSNKRSSMAGSGGVGGRIGCTMRKLTSPACLLSYLLSWVLPTPAADASYLRWSFAELQRATVRLGSFLRRRGVKTGATAVFFTAVSVEWALLLSVSALNRYTAVTLPPNSAFASNSRVLQEQIDTLAPSLIVVATQEEALRVASNVKTSTMVVGISLQRFMESAPQGWTSMADIAEEVDATAFQQDDEADSDLDRAALVIYTSGSSGEPKGCPMSSRYLLCALGLLSKQLLPMLPTPMTLIAGVSSQSRCQALTMVSWATGNAAVLDAGESSAQTILAALHTCRPVSLSLLVTTLPSIARAANYTAEAIKSVRVVHLTGATVTMAVLRTAQKTFPRARILPTFAMSEAAGTVSWTAWISPPSIDEMPHWRGIAASGTVAPGAALKIVSKDATVAPRGVVGELHLRGNSVISGYLGVNTASDAFYTGDDGHRWFISGDDALIDDQGLLYVLGRCAYTLRRDDEVVVPCTIENFLETQFQGTTVSHDFLPKGRRRLFLEAW